MPAARTRETRRPCPATSFDRCGQEPRRLQSSHALNSRDEEAIEEIPIVTREPAEIGLQLNGPMRHRRGKQTPNAGLADPHQLWLRRVEPCQRRQDVLN